MNSPRALSPLASCLLLLIVLTACQPASETIRARTERNTSPAAPAADISQLVADNNAFAFDLYHQVASEHDGNLIFSPYSISQAFAMLYAGARGDTEQQMAEVFHFSLPQDRLHPAFNALDLNLQPVGALPPTPTPAAWGSPPADVRLSIANALWGQTGYPFETTFLDSISLNYAAEIRSADFAANPEAVRHEINTWVSDQTEGLINEIASPDAVNSNTRLALLNAIYFKGDWTWPFAGGTEDGPFTRLDGSQVSTPMMENSQAYLRCGKADTYHTIELTYGESENTAMMLFVPDAGQFEAFEATWDPEVFQQSQTDTFSTNMLTLTMPRFKFESDIDLAKSLSAMNLSLPFSGGADFSGISASGSLYISSAVHKATITVHELGTEAAGTTAVFLEESGTTSECGFELAIDRPFIFAIYDTDTSAILFLGRVLDPSQN
jgi:serpin B